MKPAEKLKPYTEIVLPNFSLGVICVNQVCVLKCNILSPIPINSLKINQIDNVFKVGNNNKDKETIAPPINIIYLNPDFLTSPSIKNDDKNTPIYNEVACKPFIELEIPFRSKMTDISGKSIPCEKPETATIIESIINNFLNEEFFICMPPSKFYIFSILSQR